MELPAALRTFADRAGRLRQWPVKQRLQRLAVAYLATRFEAGRVYSERQVNLVLRDWHTFGDWALLRRMLYDWGYLDRDATGRRYWLVAVPAPDADAPPVPLATAGSPGPG